jgi:hypothetical protein
MEAEAERSPLEVRIGKKRTTLSFVPSAELLGQIQKLRVKAG